MAERVWGMRFELGRLCATRRVAEDMAARPRFAEFVKSCIGRYVCCDWGNVSAADGKANDRAVECGGERILAAYRHTGHAGPVRRLTGALLRFCIRRNISG